MFGFGNSFEKHYKSAFEAVEQGDIAEAITRFQAAMKAAKKDWDKVGICLFQIGSILTQIGEQESGGDYVAQSLTMLGDEGRSQVADDAKALLGIEGDVSVDDLVAIAWERDSRVKLRENDIQGCVTALQGATSTLSRAYGHNNAKMVAPIWRTMARLSGTSLPELAGVIGQLAEMALPIVDESGDTSPQDELWLLNYKAAAAAITDGPQALGEVLPRFKSAAERSADEDALELAAELERALSGGSSLELRFLVAEEEVAELQWRSAQA